MRLAVSLTAVSSLVVLADVLLFWLVFRREPAELANRDRLYLPSKGLKGPRRNYALTAIRHHLGDLLVVIVRKSRRWGHQRRLFS